MINVKKAFILPISDISNKFRVENNNLNIADLIAGSELQPVKIKEFAIAHRNERNKRETSTNSFRYVEIGDIDVNLGRIKHYRIFKGAYAPNNARRIMSYGDILVSTRRPTRGAIVSVPQEFDKHICSIFFTTLTIEDWNVVDPFYLALFLRTSLGRFQFQSAITETAYPVISDTDVLNMTVLLPSIDEQRRIANTYNQSVDDFFLELNEAHKKIVSSRQEIENFILGDEAEVIEAPIFGLTPLAQEDIEDSEDVENGEITEL